MQQPCAGGLHQFRVVSAKTDTLPSDTNFIRASDAELCYIPRAPLLPVIDHLQRRRKKKGQSSVDGKQTVPEVSKEREAKFRN
jgi:hypothetical protein